MFGPALAMLRTPYTQPPSDHRPPLSGRCSAQYKVCTLQACTGAGVSKRLDVHVHVRNRSEHSTVTSDTYWTEVLQLKVLIRELVAIDAASTYSDWHRVFKVKLDGFISGHV